MSEIVADSADAIVVRKKTGAPSANLLGRRFGLLTVKAKEERRHQGSVLWRCVCECGITLYFSTSDLRGSYRYTSCGCQTNRVRRMRWRHKLGSFDGQTRVKTFAQHYRHTRNGAEKRELPFTITLETFTALAIKPCAYCGEVGEPFNGIDRIDSACGYVDGNVVAACKRCNMAKSDMTVTEFRIWLDKVFNNLHVGRQPKLYFGSYFFSKIACFWDPSTPTPSTDRPP